MRRVIFSCFLVYISIYGQGFKVYTSTWNHVSAVMCISLFIVENKNQKMEVEYVFVDFFSLVWF